MSTSTTLRRAARTIGIGPLLRHVYFTPSARLRRSIAEGGPLQQWRTAKARDEMMAAAERLPTLIAPAVDRGLRVAFLTGDRFWQQTAFCFASLQHHADERIKPVIHADAACSAETVAALRRIIPWLEFVSADRIEDTLDRDLPRSRFPSLRTRRDAYPHLRKLTDIHLSRRGWTLVMDSDMLFFRRPDRVLSWAAAPERPIYMQDKWEAYGYSPRLMAELARSALPTPVNVGLYGLRSDAIDWDWMEHCCREQIAREGASYLQEQALTALAMSGTGAEPLDRRDYVVLPDLAEGRAPTAALHHYVAESKRSYFQHGWRIVRSEIIAAQN